MARCATEYYIYGSSIQLRRLSYVRSCDFCSVRAYCGAIGEVKLVYGAMNRIDLDRSRYVESRLLETER